MRRKRRKLSRLSVVLLNAVVVLVALAAAYAIYYLDDKASQISRVALDGSLTNFTETKKMLLVK